MTGRGKAPERLPIRLVAPRYVRMNAEEEARAVAALVAVLVAGDEMDAGPRASTEAGAGTAENTTGDAGAA